MLKQDRKISAPTVRKYIDSIKIKQPDVYPSRVILLIDTTYFKRVFGVTVFRDSRTCKNIAYQFVMHENISSIESVIANLKRKGFVVDAIVTDGKRGVLTLFPNIPTQMCHFHQKQIVLKYLTMKPKLEAGKELSKTANKLGVCNSIAFNSLLNDWYERWNEFLREKTYSEDGNHWSYTHDRLRKAYYSLQRNLAYLYTYEKYNYLVIPTTTNGLEGYNSHLKEKVRLHRGLSLQRKLKIISHIICKG